MLDLTIRLDEDRLELLRTVRSATDDKGRGGRRFDGAGDTWRLLAELGLLGVTADPGLGGGGGTVVDAAVVSLGLGETATEIPYAEGLAAASALSGVGGGARPAVRGHCDGSTRLIPVTPAGTGFRTVGGAAFAQLVAGAEVTLLVFDGQRPAPTLSVIPGVEPGTDVGTVSRGRYFSLADVAAGGKEEVIAEGDDARARWSRGSLLFRLLLAAELTGGERWLLQTADDYSRIRHQFGHPIGSYQGLQHVIVDMLAATEATELLVFDAADAWDDDPEGLLDLSSAALAFTRSSVHEVLQNCYCVLGGIGFMEEHAISKYSRTMLHRVSQLGPRSELHQSVGSRIRRMQWAS